MAELKPTTPQATANCYGGTGVHGPYCRQLRQAATRDLPSSLQQGVGLGIYLNIGGG